MFIFVGQFILIRSACFFGTAILVEERTLVTRGNSEQNLAQSREDVYIGMVIGDQLVCYDVGIQSILIPVVLT